MLEKAKMSVEQTSLSLRKGSSFTLDHDKHGNNIKRNDNDNKNDKNYVIKSN